MTKQDKDALFWAYYISVCDNIEGKTNSFVADLLFDFIIKNNLKDEFDKWAHNK